MFKKKKKNADTPADFQLKKLYYPFIDFRDEFYSTIRKVVVKEEVIKIYPDGADKDQAIKDYHFEQQHLLALIGKYDALAVFALSQRIPLSQITSQDVSIHFKSFAKKIITHVIYKELDLITEEQKEKINWSEASWCKPSDLINNDFDWSYYLTNIAELYYILQK